MKINIILLLLLMFSLFTNIKTTAQELYEDQGTFEYKIDSDNYFSISSEVTVDYVSNSQQIKQNYQESAFQYRYELILTSESVNNGYYSNTWIYGAKIFINNHEVTYRQFPDGFSILIKTEPTLVYWYLTNDTKIDIKISWEELDFQ